MRYLLIVVLGAGCGGGKATGPPDNGGRGTGHGQRATGNGEEDAGGAVAQVVSDAGEPGDPVVTPDAGLMELGAAQCEMVIARLIACPQIGAEFKDDLRKKQAEIRQQAVNPNEREEVAAMCRQLVEAMEETLRRLSC